MALVAFDRMRLLWGALDWQHGTGTPYSAAQTKAGGADAVGPNIGIRRAMLVFDRTAAVVGSDSAVMHFDILNWTGGAPDDTWTSTDFGQCETAIGTWYAALKTLVTSVYSLSEIRWYRAGPGITAPNPAIRVTPLGVAGTGGGTKVPPQLATSITFRTAVRRSWGRTYLPLGNIVTGNVDVAGRWTNAVTDLIATSTNGLVTDLATNDFQLVVVSKHLSAALAVEKVESDNVLDVVRRRRWKASTYKKILP